MKLFNNKKFYYILPSVIILLAAGTFYYFFKKADRVHNYTVSPSVIFYDRNGIPMRTFLSATQTYSKPVSVENVSPWMILALVAVEDKRFFTHPGIDVKAVSRAAWQNLSSGEVVSGASTITQQLVRAIEPRKKNIWSKIKEALTAVTVEKSLDKQQILEQYLNTVEFSNMVQGVEYASNYYFNTSAEGLSLSQAAFLAAMVKSPVKFNPVKNFPAALKRRNSVLQKMASNGFITDEMYDIAIRETIEITAEGRSFSAPHLAEFLLREIKTDDHEIITTIDSSLQKFVSELVPAYVAKLEKNNVTNAAVIVIDNKTGEVLAYLGSADYFDSDTQGQVNGVNALRQPGSALKPFIYALGLENGYTAATVINDEDTFFKGGFRPKNYDETFHGPVSVRNALACSYNVPVVRVAEDMGTQKIIKMLQNAGFDSLNKNSDFYGLGISLGNGEVKLLELARAYMMLANNGVFKDLRFTIRPAVGERRASKRVFGARTAFIISDILSDNNARAAAFGLNSPLNTPFAFAAKTGTSKDYRDNWALGYTPQWTIGVWAGNFDGQPMRKVSGISGAAPLLKDIAVYMHEKYGSTDFIVPQGIERRYICPSSGQLASPRCPHKKAEVFNIDNFPVEICRLHNGANESGDNFEIQFPREGDVFKIDSAIPLNTQKVLFKASGKRPLKWVVNGKQFGSDEHSVWWQLDKGEHTLELYSADGKHQKIKFLVLD
ncbi:Membrane carboxypeptidase [Elusimicrobium minutum Pei191]|uniref:peptidoglycan glycosyltransferase n=1 Tax=Elusimicrobium minutum (strain Pei191) TaxID=445932 RepID=B2KCZ5_ELUMP|nr:penicillin-binding protein 1C [Elusimicrobium minutum]ACC98391.1 Membrane carboxypeptidase [Elusimicrobium minutum Pei191]